MILEQHFQVLPMLLLIILHLKYLMYKNGNEAHYLFFCINLSHYKHSIDCRPHKGGSFYPKTPSISAYKRSDPSTMVEWGHGAKKLMLKPQSAKENIILSNFKLNLDESLHRGVAENHR